METRRLLIAAVAAITVFVEVWKIVGILPGPVHDLLVAVWRADRHVPPGNLGDYADELGRQKQYADGTYEGDYE